MRVLFVTRGWPTKEYLMLGNYEAVQAKALARKGVDVTVLNFTSWRSIYHAFTCRKPYIFIEDGVRVIQIEGFMPIIPHLLDSKRRRQNAKKLFVKFFCKRFIREYGPFDIVHAHTLYIADLASAFKKKCELPFVITEHWSKLNYEDIDTESKEMAKVYKVADIVIAVSKMLADSLNSKFGIQCRVIHNMVPDSFFDGMANSRENGVVKFIATGALFNRKGIDILVKSIANAKHRQDCQLTIIGEGVERENIQKCIDENNLRNQVKMVGLKTPEEVALLLEEADCFALTSRRETFGIVYIEAMAKGLPVIATICGGPESFVNEKNGLLVPVEDVEATANAIDYMVEHHYEYDHKQIQQFCYDNFSQDRIADQIIDVYNEVLKQKK